MNLIIWVVMRPSMNLREGMPSSLFKKMRNGERRLDELREMDCRLHDAG